MTVDPLTAKYKHAYLGHTYYFCCAHCLEKFKTDPEKYLATPVATPGSGLVTLGRPVTLQVRGDGAAIKEKDPVCGMDVSAKSTKYKCNHQGKTYYFCSAHCLEKFRDQPQRYADHAAKSSENAGSVPLGAGAVDGGELFGAGEVALRGLVASVDRERLLERLDGARERVAPAADDPEIVPEHGGLGHRGQGLCQRVLGFGKTAKTYSATYKSATMAALAELGADIDVVTQAHLLLRHHGQTICKTSNPYCGACTVREHCPSARPPLSE